MKRICSFDELDKEVQDRLVKNLVEHLTCDPANLEDFSRDFLSLVGKFLIKTEHNEKIGDK